MGPTREPYRQISLELEVKLTETMEMLEVRYMRLCIVFATRSTMSQLRCSVKWSIELFVETCLTLRLHLPQQGRRVVHSIVFGVRIVKPRKVARGRRSCARFVLAICGLRVTLATRCMMPLLGVYRDRDVVNGLFTSRSAPSISQRVISCVHDLMLHLLTFHVFRSSPFIRSAPGN